MTTWTHKRTGRRVRVAGIKGTWTHIVGVVDQRGHWISTPIGTNYRLTITELDPTGGQT